MARCLSAERETIVVGNQSDDGAVALFVVKAVIIGRQFSQLRADPVVYVHTQSASNCHSQTTSDCDFVVFSCDVFMVFLLQQLL